MLFGFSGISVIASIPTISITYLYFDAVGFIANNISQIFSFKIFFQSSSFTESNTATSDFLFSLSAHK